MDPYTEDAALLAFPTEIVSDDEESDDDEVEPSKIKTNIPKERGGKKVSFNLDKTSGSVETETDESDIPNVTNFDLYGPTEGETTPNIIDDEEDRQPTPKAAELLRYHQQFGHAPFRKIQELAKAGVIPKKLAKCKAPVCSACMFAKATRRRWRDKILTRNLKEVEELT
eukprot:scaffold192055_cov31-Attheya_sp.AAC.1